eukprot:TRINITY_DN34025_c0_g1_i1.p1 TRINITY_DN34025_c0_g1~~TRINITY_DN34025_c0_g1_i1.p1  ORF type:complete len:510 (-),score=32.35 TRINITY_DN34025_c0_g1_i1:43-1572(-)
MVMGTFPHLVAWSVFYLTYASRSGSFAKDWPSQDSLLNSAFTPVGKAPVVRLGEADGWKAIRNFDGMHVFIKLLRPYGKKSNPSIAEAPQEARRLQHECDIVRELHRRDPSTFGDCIFQLSKSEESVAFAAYTLLGSDETLETLNQAESHTSEQQRAQWMYQLLSSYGTMLRPPARTSPDFSSYGILLSASSDASNSGAKASFADLTNTLRCEERSFSSCLIKEDDPEEWYRRGKAWLTYIDDLFQFATNWAYAVFPFKQRPEDPRNGGLRQFGLRPEPTKPKAPSALYEAVATALQAAANGRQDAQTACIISHEDLLVDGKAVKDLAVVGRLHQGRYTADLYVKESLLEYMLDNKLDPVSRTPFDECVVAFLTREYGMESKTYYWMVLVQGMLLMNPEVREKADAGSTDVLALTNPINDFWRTVAQATAWPHMLGPHVDDLVAFLEDHEVVDQDAVRFIHAVASLAWKGSHLSPEITGHQVEEILVQQHADLSELLKSPMYKKLIGVA